MESSESSSPLPDSPSLSPSRSSPSSPLSPPSPLSPSSPPSPSSPLSTSSLFYPCSPPSPPSPSSLMDSRREESVNMSSISSFESPMSSPENSRTSVTLQSDSASLHVDNKEKGSPLSPERRLKASELSKAFRPLNETPVFEPWKSEVFALLINRNVNQVSIAEGTHTTQSRIIAFLQAAQPEYNLEDQQTTQVIKNSLKKLVVQLDLISDRLEKSETECRIQKAKIEGLDHLQNSLRDKIKLQEFTFETLVYDHTELKKQKDSEIETLKNQLLKSQEEMRLMRSQENAMLNRLMTSADIINQQNQEIELLRNRLAMSDPKNSQSGVDPTLMMSSLEGPIIKNQKPPIRWARVISRAHTDAVLCCKYDPHRSILVTGGADKSIKIWDCISGTLAGSLRGPTMSVRSIDLSLDDRHILACSNDKNLYFWRRGEARGDRSLDGITAHCLVGHNDKVTCGFFSDGSRIVSGSHDRTLKIWDFSRSSCIATTPSLGSKVSDLCSVPALGSIVSSHFDGSLRFSDPRSLKSSLDRLDNLHSSQSISGIHISPDGLTLLTNGRDSRLHLVDLRKMSVVMSYDHSKYCNGSESNKAVFTATGKQVIAGGSDGSIFVWESVTGNLTNTLAPKATAIINSLAISPEGNQMAVACQDKSIILWED